MSEAKTSSDAPKKNPKPKLA